MGVMSKRGMGLDSSLLPAASEDEGSHFPSPNKRAAMGHHAVPPPPPPRSSRNAAQSERRTPRTPPDGGRASEASQVTALHFPEL